jgi:tetraacyldisaccharide 4'-kinase
VRSAPPFWWRRRPGIAALALWPAGRLYGSVAAWRMVRKPRLRPSVPVICVGNLVVGGAGKTPVAIALARIARGRGMRPGFLTRGYGGNETGPVLVPAGAGRPDRFGDEAPLLAAAAPTVLSHDRAAGARRLIEERVDLIIMDDGFQNPGLAKDFSFVVVDAGAGIGNGQVMPAGPLRAPLGPQLRQAGALVVVGEGEEAERVVRAAARAARPTLRAVMKPPRVKEWRNGPVLAFAGIGRPEKFFDTLRGIGARVDRTRPFPDHHPSTEADASELLSLAEGEGLRLVTTEKDMARLAGTSGAVARLRDRTEAFPVIVEFENPAAVGEMIGEAVDRAARRGAA